MGPFVLDALGFLEGLKGLWGEGGGEVDEGELGDGHWGEGTLCVG